MIENSKLFFINNDQKTGLKRNTIDKFYTKKLVAESCLNSFNQVILPNDNDLIIEPSAGNGSFINGIKIITNNYLFYDIEPDNDEIINQDYLLLETDQFKNGIIHVIGNPPFGKQSSLAIKFIKKSCSFCHTLSFILPKSFKKETYKRAFPLSFHLKYEIELSDKSFLVNGKDYTVPCVFQIWKKEIFERKKPVILKPNNFIFVKKDEIPDVSIRRVGVYAGKIDKNVDKNVQSHYFIKFMNDKPLDYNINLLCNIKYEFNNTGPRSISKQELMSKINHLL